MIQNKMFKLLLNWPVSELLGLSAAAASLAIMGEMTPLLAEIFSMMEEVAKEVGVDAMAPSAPEVV